jgi:sugar phosphate isomerase/epimerase
MRLGGPIFQRYADPDAWVAAVQAKGYRAAYCPVRLDAADDDIQRYAHAAQAADIVIAEVGVWNNPISPDPETRRAAMDKCKRSLALADKIGARCCVNVAGARGPSWSGPYADNVTEDTFEMIVSSVQEIIDAVQPTRTYYTLEAMPWVYPDSVDSYVRLIEAIDRAAFAVHLDPANLVSCPRRYFDTTALLRECFAKLGPHVRSCHAKDIFLHDQLTVHFEEVRPGTGGLDYAAFLSELDRLHPDVPLMLEHLPNEQEYGLAAAFIRSTAQQLQVTI